MVERDALYSSFDGLFRVYAFDDREVLNLLTAFDITLEHKTAGHVLRPIKKIRDTLTMDPMSREYLLGNLLELQHGLEASVRRMGDPSREFHRQMAENNIFYVRNSDIIAENDEALIDMLDELEFTHIAGRVADSVTYCAHLISNSWDQLYHKADEVYEKLSKIQDGKLKVEQSELSEILEIIKKETLTMLRDPNYIMLRLVLN